MHLAPERWDVSSCSQSWTRSWYSNDFLLNSCSSSISTYSHNIEWLSSPFSNQNETEQKPQLTNAHRPVYWSLFTTDCSQFLCSVDCLFAIINMIQPIMRYISWKWHEVSMIFLLLMALYYYIDIVLKRADVVYPRYQLSMMMSEDDLRDL
jgi:hypothetical protein